MDGTEWIERFAGLAGLSAPDAKTVEALLALAATAAHSSERTAAPIACYLAGVSGRPVEELAEIAEQVA